MQGDLFDMPDQPELREYLAAWRRSIEKLALLSAKLQATDPARAAHLRVMAQRETNELLRILEWLDLR